MKKTWRNALIVSAIVITATISSAIIISATSTSAEEIMKSAYDQLKKDLDDLKAENSADPGAAYIAELDEIKITQERFKFYKANVLMVQELNRSHQLPAIDYTDEQLIESLVKKDLLIQYAKSNGITATPDEIEKTVEYERSALYSPEFAGPDADLARSLMANRIALTGMSEDEFWRSDIPRQEYEKAIITNKLMKRLMEENKISTIEAFTRFEDELFAEVKDRLIIRLKE